MDRESYGNTRKMKIRAGGHERGKGGKRGNKRGKANERVREERRKGKREERSE
jgi:hypothetical protein